VTSGSGPRWLWYSCRTLDCVPLDRDAYPITIYDRRPVPWPEWACKAPDGGIHYNASLGSFDIRVASPPRGREEFQWTCEFQVFVLHRDWFSAIEDLADGSGIGVGQLLIDGRRLENWVSIHGRRPPVLRSSEGWEKSPCPICGNPHTLFRGRPFFSDAEVQDMPLIVNDKGIFVREDEVIRRNLRTPLGAYKPGLVRFELSTS
jgi:hypothetical protein